MSLFAVVLLHSSESLFRQSQNNLLVVEIRPNTRKQMSEFLPTEFVCGRDKVGRHAFPNSRSPACYKLFICCDIHASFKIDPSRETTSRVWRRQPGQRLVRASPIPERAPVSSMVSSSSSDSVPDLDPVIVEMVDNTVNETGFSPAPIRAITDIIAAAFAQERAQNQVPPSSSNQTASPVAMEREAPELALGNQASADNVSPEYNMSKGIKRLAFIEKKDQKLTKVWKNLPSRIRDVNEVALERPFTSATGGRARNLQLEKASRESDIHMRGREKALLRVIRRFASKSRECDIHMHGREKHF
ncbi:hypothetical protein JCGZ_20158 [Jatropha curcas]|uniref:Uncharacterized protein n=1 Tax=Jatropha curcas TaxID=180498 RepID=A0A067L9I3_JATCU|nr:hypothetical protein JCGZ_20158 [Jatropha curcas]